MFYYFFKNICIQISSWKNQKKKIISILAAFENQKTEYQFQDSFDEKVDYICTENTTYQI